MKTAVIVLTVVLLFFFVALSGCVLSESSAGGGIFGGEQTTTTVSPEGVTTTTTAGPWGTSVISSRKETLSCTFLPEGSEGRDLCIYDAVVMRGEPASRCNEIVDANLKADCIANSPAGQTNG